MEIYLNKELRNLDDAKQTQAGVEDLTIRLEVGSSLVARGNETKREVEFQNLKNQSDVIINICENSNYISI